MLRGKWAVLKSMDDLPKLDSYPEHVLILCQKTDEITYKRANKNNLMKANDTRVKKETARNNVELTALDALKLPKSMAQNEMTFYANEPGSESVPTEGEIIVKISDCV